MSEVWPGEEPIEPNGDEPVEEPELHEHAHPDDGIEIPEDVELLEGEVRSGRRGIGIVLARTTPETANALLQAALGELSTAGIGREQVTVMLVPGAFELPLGAVALAK